MISHRQAVLIVEPDASLRAELIEALGQRSCNVTAVRDAGSALDHLDMVKFDAIITAVDFGDGIPSGVAIARIAKKHNPATVVFFSGTTEDELRAAGAVGLGQLYLRPDALRERLAC